MHNTAIVILNWNGESLLKEFLPNAIKHSPDADIVVVDNFSSDNSVELLKKEFPSVKLLQLSSNYGFAGGYNRALKLLDYEFVILLNSDASPAENWLNPLLNALKEDDQIAIAVPKIKDYKSSSKFEYAGAAGGFIDYLGYPFCRGRIFDVVEEDVFQYEDSIEVFWASGAAFAIKRELFLQIGGFDEGFFAHQEEIDLCWRINNMGFKIVYMPQSVVYHLGGATLSSSNPHKTYLNFRNNLLMILKNYPSNKLYHILLLRFILDGIAGLKFLVSGKVWDTFAIIEHTLLSI